MGMKQFTLVLGTNPALFWQIHEVYKAAWFLGIQWNLSIKNTTFGGKSWP